MKKTSLLRWALVCLALVTVPIAAYATGNTPIDFQDRWVKGGLWIGASATAANKLTRTLGASATINFASTVVGKVDSSAITVTGAKVGDPCSVGVPVAAGAQPAQFTCYVSAADAAKVTFQPMDAISGTIALVSASPSTNTVTLPATDYTCSCAPIGGSAAIAAGGCAAAVSGTTLTVTGPNTVTTTVKYDCNQAVDPASGSFLVRITSSQ